MVLLTYISCAVIVIYTTGQSNYSVLYNINHDCVSCTGTMAEEGGDGTVEYKAFRTCTPQLVSSIKGHLGIADKLLAEGLISEDTYEDTLTQSLTDRTKAKKIVTRVRTKIQESRQNYDVFYDILDENRVYYKDLLAKLEGDCYNMLIRT